MQEAISKWWDYYNGDDVWVAIYTEQVRPKYKSKIDKKFVSEHRRDGRVVAYTLRVKEDSKEYKSLMAELNPKKDEDNCIKKRKQKRGDKNE